MVIFLVAPACQSRGFLLLAPPSPTVAMKPFCLNYCLHLVPLPQICFPAPRLATWLCSRPLQAGAQFPVRSIGTRSFCLRELSVTLAGVSKTASLCLQSQQRLVNLRFDGPEYPHKKILTIHGNTFRHERFETAPVDSVGFSFACKRSGIEQPRISAIL